MDPQDNFVHVDVGELRNRLLLLLMSRTSCSALFIDGCGALIRLKHTGPRSHLGVIIGLEGRDH